MFTLRLKIVVLTALAFMISGCATTPDPEPGSSSGTIKGVPWSAEGMFVGPRLVEGTITYGTSGPNSHVWKGTNDGTFLTGTLVRGDGRRFEGVIKPDTSDGSIMQYIRGRETRTDGCVYEGSFENQLLTGPGKIICPERTSVGVFKGGMLEGEATITYANGNKRHVSNFRNGRYGGTSTLLYADGRKLVEGYDHNGNITGLATLDYPNGDQDKMLYRTGVLLMSVPVKRNVATLTSCAALPTGWYLLKGNCVDGKPSGEVELWHKDGGERILATYKDGLPVGKSTLEWLVLVPLSEQALSIYGTMHPRLYMTEGIAREAQLTLDGKNVLLFPYWQGGFLYNIPHGTGLCMYEGKYEPCEMRAGKRVDVVQVERDKITAARTAQAIARLNAEFQQEKAERERRQAVKDREREAAFERQRQAAEDMRRAASRSPGVFSPEASAKTAREFQAIAESNARMQSQIQAAKQQLDRQSNEQQRAVNDEAARRAREAESRSQAERTRLAQAQEEARSKEMREQQSREETRRATSSVTTPPAKPTTTVPEGVAICHRNQQDYWFCDGPAQKTSVGDKGDSGLKSQLGLAGCPTPRSERASPDGHGRLFLCGTGLKGGARDVPKLRGFTVARQTYRCESGRCDSLSDSREITQ